MLHRSFFDENHKQKIVFVRVGRVASGPQKQRYAL